MKRTLSLIVLLGLVVGAVVTGCKPAEEQNTLPEAPEVPSTNAPAAP